MSDLADLQRIITSIDGAVSDFKTDYAARLDQIEKRLGRPGALTQAAAGTEKPRTLAAPSGAKATILTRGARMVDAEHKATETFDLAEFVIAQTAGSNRDRKAVSSGPALVTDYLVSQIIDKIRAASVIAEAGARTIVIDGPAAAARIDTDPTVYQHTEAADDIVASDMAVSAVTLNPKVLAAIVPVTGEALADSANLNDLLMTSLTGAFAAKLDALSIATILADEDVPESGSGQDPALWAKCLEAVGAAMAANQPLPTAMIGSTADFIARASQLASTAGVWLGKPPALAGMRELPTTNISAGTAVYGGFERAFAIAMRQELRLEVIRWHAPTRYQHALIAHMRADGVMLQPAALFRQLKTVS